MTMTVQRLRDFLRSADGNRIVYILNKDGSTSDFSVQNATTETEVNIDHKDGTGSTETIKTEVVLLTAHNAVDTEDENE